MKTVLFNNEKKQIPTSYKELTVRHFIELYGVAGKDDVGFYAAMLQVPREDVANSEDEDLDIKLLPHLAWYGEEFKYEDLKCPKKLKISDKEVDIPKDLGYKTFGQKISLMNRIQELENDLVETIPHAVAIYLYPIFADAKYDEDEANKFMHEHVYDLKIVDVYPIGDFFLRKSIGWMNTKTNSYRKIMTETNLELEPKTLKNLKSFK